MFGVLQVCWREFNPHFKLSTYTNLQATHYAEALIFVKNAYHSLMGTDLDLQWLMRPSQAQLFLAGKCAMIGTRPTEGGNGTRAGKRRAISATARQWSTQTRGLAPLRPHVGAPLMLERRNA